MLSIEMFIGTLVFAIAVVGITMLVDTIFD